MQARFKVGILVGIIGLVLNICVAGVMGICGPAVSLMAGALAGFFAARQENPASKSEGAKTGAVAGSIAGALILIGQVIGGLAALAFMQFSGTRIAFGTVPSPSADASTQILYYASGAATGLCFGVVGIVLAALCGAGSGYIGTPDKPTASLPNQ